jgi:alpha-tubulin suppressor-like RCC1 family protein
LTNYTSYCLTYGQANHVVTPSPAGNNTFGQLGDGTINTPATTPVVVAGGHTWNAISAGGFHSCAVEADGSAWCWGE